MTKAELQRLLQVSGVADSLPVLVRTADGRSHLVDEVHVVRDISTDILTVVIITVPLGEFRP